MAILGENRQSRCGKPLEKATSRSSNPNRLLLLWARMLAKVQARLCRVVVPKLMSQLLIVLQVHGLQAHTGCCEIKACCSHRLPDHLERHTCVSLTIGSTGRDASGLASATAAVGAT